MRKSRPSSNASRSPRPEEDRSRLVRQRTSGAADGTELDTLIAGLSTRFIALSEEALDREMADAQHRICECAGLDGSVLWQWSAGSRDLISITHSFLPGRGPLPPMPVYAHEYFPWAFEYLKTGKTLLLSSVEDAPADAAKDLETWRRYGVTATALFPLSSGGDQLMAIMSFHSTRGPRSWPEPLVARLRLAAQVFYNALVRISATRALRDQQTLLTSALEIARLGYYELAERETVILAGGRIHDILGIPAQDQTIPRSWWIERVHPEDRDRVLALSLQTLVGGQDRTSLEYRYCHPERGVIWLDHLSRVLARDADGKAVRVIGVMQDITVRKRTETELRDLAEFNRTILASLVDAIAILDHDGRILALNETWDRWARDPECPGLLAKVSVGTDYLETCRLAGAIEEREGIQAVLAARSGFHRSEYSAPSIRGPRWHQIDVMPLRRTGGGVVVLHRDITARRRTEEELLQLRSEIWHAHRVAQTGAIAASLAHELNQPLSAILTNAQAALRMMALPDPDLDEIREILSDIVSDDNRAADVIVGLRAMLRREQPKRASVDLEKAIRDVLMLMRSETLAHEVQVEVRAAPGLFLAADRAQILQVVLNLVMNGIEAMKNVPPAARLLEISTSEVPEGSVLLSVRDHGSGISEGDQHRVFDAFWTTKTQGMGIGLPISRSIIESHGGQLWFENHPGGGVTFFASLPGGSAAPAAARGASWP